MPDFVARMVLPKSLFACVWPEVSVIAQPPWPVPQTLLAGYVWIQPACCVSHTMYLPGIEAEAVRAARARHLGRRNGVLAGVADAVAVRIGVRGDRPAGEAGLALVLGAVAVQVVELHARLRALLEVAEVVAGVHVPGSNG